jgi:phage gp16-like protein
VTDEQFAKILERLAKIEIAIQSVNPDPAQTIQAHRDQRAAQQRAADQLVMTTEALVAATRRLGWATWALVTLTAVLTGVQLFALFTGRGPL